MKKALIFISILYLAACSKDNTTATGNTSAGGSMTIVYKGKSYVFKTGDPSTQAINIVRTTSNNGYTISAFNTSPTAMIHFLGGAYGTAMTGRFTQNYSPVFTDEKMTLSIKASGNKASGSFSGANVSGSFSNVDYREMY